MTLRHDAAWQHAHTFSLHIEDRVLDDLRLRLAPTRWPDEAPSEPWSTGSSVAYAHHLVCPRSHAQWDRVAKFAQWLRENAANS